jgi:hypothetical protein
MSKKGKGKAIAKSLAGTSHITSPQNPNPDDAFRVLRCLVEGDYASFKVTVPIHKDVDDLKKLVKAEREDSILRGIDPNILVLWKVRTSSLPPL